MAPAVQRGVPAAPLPALHDLFAWQHLAEPVVPPLPRLALHVMGHLRDVVPGIRVFAVALEVERILRHQEFEPLHQTRVLLRPAEILTAEQPLRRHRRCHGAGRLERAVAPIAVSRSVAIGHGIEESADPLERGRRHSHPGHLGGLQCHHVPAGNRHVAGFARLIPPAAIGALGRDAIGDRPSGRLREFRIAAHAIEFAESHRGLRV